MINFCFGKKNIYFCKKNQSNQIQKTYYFINPYTDFGFKKLVGEEVNKDILIDFLNTLLDFKNEKRIKNVQYLKNEHLGKYESDRKAIFDIYCETENDEKLIVEMQKAKQQFFKDRTLFYSSFLIQQQAKKTIKRRNLFGIMNSKAFILLH